MAQFYGACEAARPPATCLFGGGSLQLLHMAVSLNLLVVVLKVHGAASTVQLSRCRACKARRHTYVVCHWISCFWVETAWTTAYMWRGRTGVAASPSFALGPLQAHTHKLLPALEFAPRRLRACKLDVWIHMSRKGCVSAVLHAARHAGQGGLSAALLGRCCVHSLLALSVGPVCWDGCVGCPVGA